MTSPNLLRHVEFAFSDVVQIENLKVKNQVISKRDTQSGNLGRGGRYTKFEVNRTNIKGVMIFHSSVSFVSSRGSGREDVVNYR